MRCPICNTEIVWEDNPFRPFCSERCMLIDLGAWTEERYRIAGEGHDDEQQNEVMSDEE